VKAKKSYTIPGTDEPIEDHYPKQAKPTLMQLKQIGPCRIDSHGLPLYFMHEREKLTPPHYYEEAENKGSVLFSTTTCLPSLGTKE
jgi:hypothetical protein